MMKTSLFLFTLLASVHSHALIYGTDDRQEVWTSPRANTLARSTATMVAHSYILPEAGKSTWNLDFIAADEPYGLGLCKEEKFSSQPHGWLNCSGFLVGEDILVTAGHCMIYGHNGAQGIIENNVPASTMCDNFAWVFDFAQTADGLPFSTSEVSSERIYNCAKVLYAEALGDAQDPVTGDFSIPTGGQHGRDFAIIQLDRKVVGRTPLKISKVVPSLGEELMVVGNPSALPTKYAKGIALAGEYLNYFLSDLDITGGNSGSMVANSKDEVVGIVVRGYPYEDYQYLPERECSKNIICTKIGEGDCQATLPNEVLGTHVQKGAAILEKLQQLGLVK